ncbi:MAG: nucleotidyl transferase AbiEii/AbiGii toxin family protein [Egibacteraceae bacterium]
MRLEQARAFLAALEREQVHCVLIGSMAMAAHGLVRATRDIDFFVAAHPENVERLKRALRSVFDDDSIDEIDTGDLAGAYPVIQYGPPHGEFTIDFVARLGDAFVYDDIDAEVMVVDGIQVRVATPRMLYEMKRDTVRPQDRIDAERLRQRFGLEVER